MLSGVAVAVDGSTAANAAAASSVRRWFGVLVKLLAPLIWRGGSYE